MEIMEKFRTEVLEGCKATVKQKIEELEGAILEISESMENETKSSVGDKHETARARMQFEHEKLQIQEGELREQLNELERIGAVAAPETIFTGSVVETNRGFFFIAVALGKIVVNEQPVFVISPKSPIGQLVLGLRTGDEFTMNGTLYKILKVQ